MSEYAVAVLDDEPELPLGDGVSEETIVLSYEELEEAIVMYLRHNGDLQENEFVVHTDIPIPIEEDGTFDFDITIGTR